MAWIQIRLNSTNEKAEKISDFLEEIGSVSVTFMDSQDTPIFEPLPGETRLWGNTDVIALFDAETDMNEIVSLLKQAHHLYENTAYKIEQIEDKDWEREWMDNFHPMQFGQRLWICPSWREVPDQNAVNVMLDPGLAFWDRHPPDNRTLFRVVRWFGFNWQNRNRFWLWLRNSCHSSA